MSTDFKLVESSNISRVHRGFWNYSTPEKLSAVDYLYQIGLFDLEKFKDISVPNADPAAEFRGNPWFQFPVPPQTYEMTENPATTVVPTQGGGKFIESQGVLFRDIRLTGTVGIRPHALSSNIIPAGITAATGVSLNIPSTIQRFNKDSETGLPKDISGNSEITGYDDIIFLRNLFRAYWDYKNSNVFARKVVMIWISAKDSDIFVVEPMGFVTTRDKSNPFGWNYQITLRTLYRFNSTITKHVDAVSLFDNAMNVISTIRQAAKDIAKLINQIYNATSFIMTLPIQIASSFIGVGLDVYNAIRSFDRNLETVWNSGISNLENLCKQFSDQAVIINKAACKALAAEQFGLTAAQAEQWEKAIAKGDPLPLPASTPDDQLAQYAIDVHRNPVIEATIVHKKQVNVCKRQLLYIVNQNRLLSVITEVYNKNGLQFNAGSPLNLNNMNIPSSVDMDVVGANETIRSIAKRTMGDESYWKMIAIVNNLKSPYVSTTSRDGVLAYNSKIMIPKRAEEQDIGSVSVERSEDEESQQETFMLRQFGRDLKLSTGSSGTDYSDIQVSAQGDLDLVDREANMSQAIMIKFATEQGELPLHSEFGAMYPLGTKLKLPSLQEFILNTRKTLIQDNRISDVLDFRVYSSADIIHVKARAKLRQSNVTLPVAFSVRRS